MIIRDGKGTGSSLHITSENRASTDTISRIIDQHLNEVYEKVYSLPFEAIDPVGADDYFVYIKNTGTKNLHVVDFRIRSTVVGIVEVRAVSGTASFTSGTDITPVNRTVGSTSAITATIKTDTDTTGLTNNGVLYYMRLDTANKDFYLESRSHIIIPPGQAISLLWDTATGILAGVIGLYEEQ